MATLDNAPRVVLADLVADHDVVGVSEEAGREFVIVTPRGGADAYMDRALAANVTAVDTSELGTAAPSPWTSWVRQEYNNELVGINGLRVYDKMRRNDGTVRGTLRAVKTPVLSAKWFVEPASDSDRDKKKALFVWKCLTEWQSISWSQILTESLLMMDFGYYMFEKVWARGEDVTDDPMARGKVIWKKFAPRHPMDVKEWHYDRNGGPRAVTLYSSPASYSGLQGGMIHTGSLGGIQEVDIPIGKLLVMSFDKEAGNIEGVSILRSAYKHWYYKDNLYKIDAIQKERHGIGIPIIKLPVNFSVDDKTLANELGRNLRTNERAHIVLPPGWELLFAKLEGQPVDALKSAEHHDKQIRANVLTSFLGENSPTKEEDQTMFLKATRFIADILLDVFNMYAIPELCRVNFMQNSSGFPKLRARRIGEQSDWRTMSFAIRNYVGAGIIRPDNELEKAIREDMSLPPADPTTIRETATPQNPGAKSGAKPEGNSKPEGSPNPPKPPRVGMPRQSPKPPVGTPSAGAGRDSSGKGGTGTR